MRAMYAVYHGKVYEETDQRLNPDGLVYADATHMETEKDPKEGLVKVDINILNESCHHKTNADLFKQACEIIKEEKLKYLEKLSNNYRVYVEYELYDEIAETIVDSGFVVKDIKSAIKMRPLYLTTPDNNFVSAFPLSFMCHIRRHFRTSVPYGLIAQKKDSYVFKISSITIRQAKVSASLQKVDIRRPSENSHCNKGIHGLHGYHPFRHPYPFSNEESSYCGNAFYHMSGLNGSDSFIRNSIEIYSSLEEHLEFKPVYFKFAPREIDININFTLDGAFVVNDYTDICNVLEENKKIPEDIPDKSEDTNEEVNPDDNNPEIPDESNKDETQEPPKDEEGTTNLPPFVYDAEGEIEI